MTKPPQKVQPPSRATGYAKAVEERAVGVAFARRRPRPAPLVDAAPAVEMRAWDAALQASIHSAI